jgi:O-antigen ligase
VAKKRARKHPKRSAEAVSSDPGAAIAAVFTSVVLVGAALFVDSGAQASFDAPKRLAATVGLALAAAAAFVWAPRREPRPDDPAVIPSPRLAAWLLAGALLWAVLSAVLSPRREASFDALRLALLCALALPLGASRVAAKWGRHVLGVFLCALAVDAAVSIAQSRHWYQPFQLSTAGMRDDTGAFAGNVGYLSIALALGLTACLCLVFYAKGARTRVAGVSLALLFVLDLAVNRNLTAILASAVGAVVLVVTRFGRRSAIPLAAAVGMAVLVAVGYAPMRERVAYGIRALQVGDWDRLVTYRGGAWVSALEMTRDRPLLGYGPGTFSAEFVPHRLAAEIRWRRRFVNPLMASSYSETHCDYLQPFAEIGVPGALALLSAGALLVFGLGRKLTRSAEDGRAEPALLLSVLAAGATAALLWFPLQRPITAVPLLLAAGRAWRVCRGEMNQSEPKSPPHPDPLPEGEGAWKRPAMAVAVVAVLAAAVWPEFSRYVAERKLRLLEGALNIVLARHAEIADPPAALNRIAEMALQASNALPADPRPLLIAGGARLTNGEGDAALAFYRSAIAAGERAETDLNFGRACDALARASEAQAWFVRAGWVSPPLLRVLLPDVAAAARTEIQRLQAELLAGRLAAPPPLPQ